MQKLKFETEGLQAVFSEPDMVDIHSALHQRHAPYLEDEEFVVEAGFDAERVQVRMTLRKRDGSVAYPIECVHLREPGSKDTPFALATTMLDYLEIYWAEYLGEGRDTFVTLDWSSHTFEDAVFQVRGSVRHLSLEAQADELLRQHGFGEHDIETISSET